MRPLLITAVVVVLVWPQAPAQDTAADDIAIYKAVIDHTIRPEVIRFDKGAGIDRPIILMVNRTLAICEASRRVPLPHSCLMEGAVQSFEKPLRNGSMIFDDLVAGPVRADLAKSLMSRNDQNYSFPSLGIDGLLLADPEQIDEALKKVPRVTRGFAGFSRPGYFDPRSHGYVIGDQKLTERTQALLYATYFCGGGCGSGWLFLLERRDSSWRVQSRHMVWIA